MERTIDPTKYVTWQQMMLTVCEGCIYSGRAKTLKDYIENSKICHPCYHDMEKRFEEGEPFKIDW